MFIGISTITRGQTPAKSSLWSHEIYQTRCRRNRCQGAQHLGLGTRSWDLGKASTQFLWQFLDDKKRWFTPKNGHFPQQSVANNSADVNLHQGLETSRSGWARKFGRPPTKTGTCLQYMYMHIYIYIYYAYIATPKRQNRKIQQIEKRVLVLLWVTLHTYICTYLRT